MPRARRRGLGRIAAGALVVAGAALGLSACDSTSNGQNLARQACVHVDRSIADYELGTRTATPPARATQLLQEADSELRDALPLAAAANSDDGTWNSLMTTISESAIVDEGHLVPALRATCALADANQNVNPATPTSTTPQNVNPQPAAPVG
ncbi:MAG TPA: hypothetical protein VEG62_04720 [Acidimicrobiales bacterium]|nr:hypothetical protein [Acidimicrobiales bacterium]